MSGSLKNFDPGNPSAEALSRGCHQYYLWKLAHSSQLTLKDGGDGSKATGSDWMDLIGSAGMVMGAIKKKDGDQRKLVITIQNSSPHVVVPFQVKVPSDDFYARSNLYVMTPGDSSEVEFNINTGFYYGSEHEREFYIHFEVVASNGKSTHCYLHLDAIDGDYFVPKVFSAEGYGKLHFPYSDQESDKNFPMNYTVAAEGSNDSPSFALSMVKVVVDPEDGTSKVGFVISPWKVGTVTPHSGFFTFPTSGEVKPKLYSDPHEGAVDVGKMAWNYLKRSNGDAVNSLMSAGLRGASVGGVASLVTMGVNLLMGARNLNRKDKGNHNIVVSVKNMSSHTMSASHVQRSENCYIDNSLIPPHGEGTVNLGTRNFAGGSIDDNDWPGLVLSVSDGTAETSFEVGFCDTSHSGFSGQIRVRHIVQNGFWATDAGGFELRCDDLPFSFYKSMANGMPEFLMMSSPVSTGDADMTLVFIN